MRENVRQYFLISLAFHLCVILLLFMVEGPRVSEVIPRRVVIEFSQRREPMQALAAPQQTRLPDLQPRELADSLQMQGPRTLSIPGVAPAIEVSPLQRSLSGAQRLTSAREEKPLLPELRAAPGAAPISPAQLLSREIKAQPASPLEESGFTESGALEWRGRERKLLKTAEVAFPDILLEEGLEVDVMAAFSVAANGQVIAVDILRSSGYASVDRAVERALRGYLFEPSEGMGEDVGQIQYRFRLERSD
jgi:TonB family protein